MLYQSEILRELHRFAAFARSKPADEEYEFSNTRDCACGQYLRAHGLFRYDWSFPGKITPEMDRLNTLARFACRSFGSMGRWDDLLKVVEQEIEQELTKEAEHV